MISVGEASGDMHAATALQKVIANSNRDVFAFGMGGRKLAACGMEIVIDNEQHSVMGLIEVLKKYPQLKSNLNTLKRLLKERQPDVLLLVDYPTFNMKLAVTAKALGVPVVYFIAPKVWASRPKRIEKLSVLVDHMAVILPFEVKIFEDAGIPTTYVGNPLLDNTKLVESSNNNIVAHPGPRVALLPGSRKSEINYLLPTMLAAAALLKEKHPHIEFVLPLANTIDQSMIDEFVKESTVAVDLISTHDYNAVAASKAAIVASGTATLELAILGVPMTVAYRMNRLSYAVLKRWLSIEFISLTNIIAERGIVPELLQDDVTAQSLFDHTDRLLCDENHHGNQKAALRVVYDKLGTPGATTRLAELLKTMVANKQLGSDLNQPTTNHAR